MTASLSLADIVAAHETVLRHLPPTPMWTYPVLNARVGATVYVKHENVQPTGAFKVRGGLVLLAGMTPAERGRGLVTYSTGNHAQSIAYACAAFGAPCTVVMPAHASSTKVDAVRALGAEALLHGAGLGDAQKHAEHLASATGARLVSPGDTPELLAGVGTLYLEILRARPELEAIVVPVGSGTGAASAAVVAAAVAPGCRIVAVQSQASPAAHDSWRAGTCVDRPNLTTVDGLASGRGFALPQSLMRGGLAAFHLVTDAEIARAQRWLAAHAHTLAEGAGAAALAGVCAHPDEFAGRSVAVVCTGGNANAAEITALGADPGGPGSAR